MRLKPNSQPTYNSHSKDIFSKEETIPKQTYKINPNDPAYILGRVVVRPAFDAIVAISSNLYAIISNSFSHIGELFSSTATDDFIQENKKLYAVSLHAIHRADLNEVIDEAKLLGAKINLVFTSSFTGFTGEMTPEVLEMLNIHPYVEHIEYIGKSHKEL
jgi:hypothetical protein